MTIQMIRSRNPGTTAIRRKTLDKARLLGTHADSPSFVLRQIPECETKMADMSYATGSLPPFETPTKEEQGTTHQFAICGEIMNTDKAQSTPDFETEINFDCILSTPIATAFRWNTVTTFARF